MKQFLITSQNPVAFCYEDFPEALCAHTPTHTHTVLYHLLDLAKYSLRLEQFCLKSVLICSWEFYFIHTFYNCVIMYQLALSICL